MGHAAMARDHGELAAHHAQRADQLVRDEKRERGGKEAPRRTR